MISTEIFVFILAVLIAIVSTLCIALLGVVKRKGNGTKNGSTGEPAGKLYNDDAGFFCPSDHPTLADMSLYS